jgi:hypothetical protein
MVKAVFAQWTLETLPEDLGEFHISCGIKDEQWEGFTHEDAHARLVISSVIEGFDVTLYCFSEGIENHPDYWLSPNAINGETEAKAWGIHEVDL